MLIDIFKIVDHSLIEGVEAAREGRPVVVSSIASYLENLSEDKMDLLISEFMDFMSLPGVELADYAALRFIGQNKEDIKKLQTEWTEILADEHDLDVHESVNIPDELEFWPVISKKKNFDPLPMNEITSKLNSLNSAQILNALVGQNEVDIDPVVSLNLRNFAPTSIIGTVGRGDNVSESSKQVWGSVIYGALIGSMINPKRVKSFVLASLVKSPWRVMRPIYAGPYNEKELLKLFVMSKNRAEEFRKGQLRLDDVGKTSMKGFFSRIIPHAAPVVKDFMIKMKKEKKSRNIVSRLISMLS